MSEAPKDQPQPKPPEGGGSGDENRPPPTARGLLLVAVVMLILIAVAAFSNGFGGGSRSDYYEALRLLQEGRLDPESMVFHKEKALFHARLAETENALPGGRRAVSVYFVTEREVDRFRQAMDEYNTARASQDKEYNWKVKDAFFFQSVVSPLLWLTLILFIFFLFLRQMRGVGPGSGVFNFGKSRARVRTENRTGITFEDVAGADEAKDEVAEIVQFLRDPPKFQRLGGRIPRGVLLIGSPGTGKTLLAKAIAGEAGRPFFSISGSDFVEMFVGVGAARVRDLFKQARENSPCIVFLDEVDAVGRRRGTGLGGGHDEREQTLNAILVEMDGFDSHQGTIVVAATNRPDVLDPALLRPGRFDRQVTVDLPDAKGREQILAVHAKDKKVDPAVRFDRIARSTPGFSGAELAALLNEAAIIAALNEQEAIVEANLDEARDKIRWGREKRSRVIDEDDRLITAYHEAGHALIAHQLEECEPVHKVTIIPRGMALGSVMQLPERDRTHMSRREMVGLLTLLYGGRASEQIFCDDITAGAQNDIQRATTLARRMVCEFGMSEELGPINYSDDDETFFFGREMARARNYSEHLAQRIDEEVRKVIDGAYQRAKQLIESQKEAVERIVAGLLERETLSGEDIDALVAGRPLGAPEGA